MAYLLQLLDQPHNGKLPSRLAAARYQNSLAPQLLSNIYWSKTKTSISLNRVYWYDTMCHIFSCISYGYKTFRFQDVDFEVQKSSDPLHLMIL